MGNLDPSDMSEEAQELNNLLDNMLEDSTSGDVPRETLIRRARHLGIDNPTEALDELSRYGVVYSQTVIKRL